jgi:hypothetical protein
MTDVFIYADETGDLDMTGARGTSTYFGFGTAVLLDDHGHQLWQGQQLRCALEAKGVRLPAGVHAKNDSHATRDEVFDLIRRQARAGHRPVHLGRGQRVGHSGCGLRPVGKPANPRRSAVQVVRKLRRADT